MAAPIRSAASVRAISPLSTGVAVETSRGRGMARSGPPAGVAVDVASDPVNQRELAQVQARNARAQDQQRILQRVDSLVQGMESLAKRISSDELSSSQRSVLRSRFNELEQQVNRIDGIVGGEGREAQGEKALTRAVPSRASGSDSMERHTPADRVRVVREHVQAGQRRVASRRAQALQAVEQQLQAVPGMAPREAAAVARAAAEDIRAQGTQAVRLAASGNMVDMNA